MMNFVQQQEDLYNFDDQSLADELQSGRRGYNQIVVLSEIQRRTKERGEAQQQAMAQQAQQNQPVAERQLMEFMAQAQPAQASPEMAMQGGAEGMPPEMMAAAMPAAMPPEMPAEAPVGIAAGMPQQMAGGGTVGKAKEFGEAYADMVKQRGIIGLVPGVSGYAEALRQLMSLRQRFPSTPEATGFGKYFPETDKAGLSLGRVDLIEADPNLDDPESDALDRQYRDFVASQMYAPYHSTSQGFDPTAGGTYDPGSQVNSSISGASSLLPPYGMYKGGSVRRAQFGIMGSPSEQNRITSQYIASQRRELQRKITQARMRGNDLEALRLTDELQALLPGSGSPSTAFKGARDIADIAGRMSREIEVKDAPEFDLTLPQDRQAAAPAETAAETVAETRATPTGRGVTTLPTYMPSSFDFGSQYTRNLADIALQPVTIKSQRATPESVQAASEAAKNSFFAQEMERLRKFAPDKERFQRESQSDLLVGLGSVIAGATQRGDIAKGLAQLAAQQREARRGFRGEEREYEMLQSSLRREQRADERAEEERRYQRERAAAEAERMSRAEALAITTAQAKTQTDLDQLQIAREKLRQDERQFQENLKIATTKAERDAAVAGLQQTKAALEMAETQINALSKLYETASLPGGRAFLESYNVKLPTVSTAADIKGGR